MMIDCLYLSITRKSENKTDEIKLFLQGLAGKSRIRYANVLKN